MPKPWTNLKTETESQNRAFKIQGVLVSVFRTLSYVPKTFQSWSRNQKQQQQPQPLLWMLFFCLAWILGDDPHADLIRGACWYKILASYHPQQQNKLKLLESPYSAQNNEPKETNLSNIPKPKPNIFGCIGPEQHCPLTCTRTFSTTLARWNSEPYRWVLCLAYISRTKDSEASKGTSWMQKPQTGNPRPWAPNRVSALIKAVSVQTLGVKPLY